jgi:hypothetical protein
MPDVDRLSIVAFSCYPGVEPGGALTQQIDCCLHNEIGIVLKSSYASVAVATQQTANLASRVVMVDVKAGGSGAVPGGFGLANGAPAVLLGQKQVVIFKGHSVETLEIGPSFEVWVSGILSRLVSSRAFRRVSLSLTGIEAVSASAVVRRLWEAVFGLHLAAFGTFVHE